MCSEQISNFKGPNVFYYFTHRDAAMNGHDSLLQEQVQELPVRGT